MDTKEQVHEIDFMKSCEANNCLPCLEEEIKIFKYINDRDIYLKTKNGYTFSFTKENKSKSSTSQMENKICGTSINSAIDLPINSHDVNKLNKSYSSCEDVFKNSYTRNKHNLESFKPNESFHITEADEIDNRTPNENKNKMLKTIKPSRIRNDEVMIRSVIDENQDNTNKLLETNNDTIDSRAILDSKHTSTTSIVMNISGVESNLTQELNSVTEEEIPYVDKCENTFSNKEDIDIKFNSNDVNDTNNNNLIEEIREILVPYIAIIDDLMHVLYAPSGGTVHRFRSPSENIIHLYYSDSCNNVNLYSLNCNHLVHYYDTVTRKIICSLDITDSEKSSTEFPNQKNVVISNNQSALYNCFISASDDSVNNKVSVECSEVQTEKCKKSENHLTGSNFFINNSGTCNEYKTGLEDSFHQNTSVKVNKIEENLNVSNICSLRNTFSSATNLIHDQNVSDEFKKTISCTNNSICSIDSNQNISLQTEPNNISRQLQENNVSLRTEPNNISLTTKQNNISKPSNRISHPTNKNKFSRSNEQNILPPAEHCKILQSTEQSNILRLTTRNSCPIEKNKVSRPTEQSKFLRSTEQSQILQPTEQNKIFRPIFQTTEENNILRSNEQIIIQQPYCTNFSYTTALKSNSSNSDDSYNEMCEIRWQNEKHLAEKQLAHIRPSFISAQSPSQIYEESQQNEFQRINNSLLDQEINSRSNLNPCYVNTRSTYTTLSPIPSTVGMSSTPFQKKNNVFDSVYTVKSSEYNLNGSIKNKNNSNMFENYSYNNLDGNKKSRILTEKYFEKELANRLNNLQKEQNIIARNTKMINQHDSSYNKLKVQNNNIPSEEHPQYKLTRFDKSMTINSKTVQNAFFNETSKFTNMNPQLYGNEVSLSHDINLQQPFQSVYHKFDPFHCIYPTTEVNLQPPNSPNVSVSKCLFLF